MALRRAVRRAYSFLEIMCVVVIIGILTALVAPGIAGNVGKSRQTATQTQMNTISEAAKQFELAQGTYPRDLSALLKDEQAGKHGYLDAEDLPKDAWGEEFSYKAPGEHNRLTFDLSSAGPDREAGTDDDLVNWKRR